MRAGFHLQDIGAEIGEVTRGERTGPSHRQIEHANTRQRKPHVFTFGGRCAKPRRRKRFDVEWHRRPNRRNGTGDRREAAAFFPMRRQRQFGEVRHRGHRNAPRLPLAQPVSGGLCLERRNQNWIILVGAIHPLQCHQTFRIVREIRQADQLTQRNPLRRCQRRYADPAVTRLIDSAGERRREAVDATACDFLARQSETRRSALRETEIGFEDVQIDAPALPAGVTSDHGRERCEKCRSATDNLRRVSTRKLRRAIFRASRVGHAAHRLD